MENVRPEWAEVAVNRMHYYGIRIRQVSEETGYCEEYVNRILSGVVISIHAQTEILFAIERLIAKRKK